MNPVYDFSGEQRAVASQQAEKAPERVWDLNHYRKRPFHGSGQRELPSAGYTSSPTPNPSEEADPLGDDFMMTL